MAVNGVTTTLTPTNASDAQFRAWGSAISAKIVASGFTVTGDTGQINWASVTAPVAINTSQGYELYTFADTLQATAPITFKIEYGSGASSANNPSLWLTFGTGSNGTGTITGNASTRVQIYTTAYATNALSCYWSGSTSHFMAALYCAGTGASSSITSIVSFERTKDYTGADTSQGVQMVYKPTTNGNTYHQHSWDRALGTGSIDTSLGMLLPPGTTGKTGLQTAVYPIMQNITSAASAGTGPFINPPVNILGYFQPDLTTGSTIAFDIYGTSHTYMPIGTLTAPTTFRTGGAVALLTRYE